MGMLVENAVKNGNVRCVIIAAGMGRRQGPATDMTTNRFALAKPLLPVAGRKIIDFPISAAAQLGLREVTVSAGKYWKLFNKMLLSPERLHSRDNGIEVKIHGDETPRDTVGHAIEPLNPLRKGETIIVLCGDIVSNISLKAVLEAHLKSKAAATVVALPVPWESEEWVERSFPVIITERMPKMSGGRPAFENSLSKYLSDMRGKTLKVSSFPEKTERAKCPTNLSPASIFVFSSDFLMDISPFVTHREAEYPFSDFGFHIFPLLAGRFGGLPKKTLESVIKQIKKGAYPFYAYVPAKTGADGNPLFWYDICDPQALWKVNMTALRGLAHQWIGTDGGYQRTDWGYVGNSTYISNDVRMGDIPERSYRQDGLTIIGSNVSLASEVMIGRSFIDDYTNLQPGTEVFNSVVSLGLSRPTSYIGKTRLVNCLVLGEGFPPDFADIRMLRNALIFNVPYFDGFGIVPLQLKPSIP